MKRNGVKKPQELPSAKENKSENQSLQWIETRQDF